MLNSSINKRQFHLWAQKPVNFSRLRDNFRYSVQLARSSHLSINICILTTTIVVNDIKFHKLYTDEFVLVLNTISKKFVSSQCDINEINKIYCVYTCWQCKKQFRKLFFFKGKNWFLTQFLMIASERDMWRNTSCDQFEGKYDL